MSPNPRKIRVQHANRELRMAQSSHRSAMSSISASKHYARVGDDASRAESLLRAAREARDCGRRLELAAEHLMTDGGAA